ncbi:MAG TPA: hypothetical protein VJK50_02220 [Patescibacteria group bacterium]|nr:hypothetical protein [Patescibacteria group bacterium]
MATTIEYALLAGASYYDTRADINRFPIPKDWDLLSRIPESSTSGFEASAYRNALTNEIVISYAGTGPGLNVDWIANFALALGTWSDQLPVSANLRLESLSARWARRIVWRHNNKHRKTTIKGGVPR